MWGQTCILDMATWPSEYPRIANTKKYVESRREVRSESVVNTCLVVGSPPDPT